MRRPVILVSLATFAAMGAGFLREVAVAYYFGTSGDADAFALAMFYVDGISAVAFAGMAGYLMVPVVTQVIQERGEEEGFRLLETCLLWISALAVPVVAVLLWRVNDVATLIAPEFDAARRATLVRLLYCAVPTAYLILVSGVMSGVLQARRDYYTPVHGRTLLALCTAALLLLAERPLGVVAAGVGLLCGSVAQIALQVHGLRRLQWRPRRGRFGHPALTHTIRAAVPILLALVLMNVLLGGAQRALASGLPVGAFSAVNYAQRALSLVSGLALSLATVSLTELSVGFRMEGMSTGTFEMLRESLESGVFMLLPLSALLYVASEPLIAVLFHRGRYDLSSLSLTVACLQWLTLSVVPGMALGVLHRAAPAFGRPWRATVTAAAWALATLAATVPLLPGLGAQALAAGFSIGTFVAACVSALVLRDIVPLAFYRPVLAYAGRVAIIAAGGLAAGLGTLHLLGMAPNLSGLESATRLLAVTAAFGLTTVIVGIATHDPHVADLLSKVRIATGRADRTHG